MNQTTLLVPDFLFMTHHPNILTLEICKEICEKSITCLSIEWQPGCYLNEYQFNASEFHSIRLASHHVVDRKEKSVDRCIGEGYLFFELI